jgi:hypothetical protein
VSTSAGTPPEPDNGRPPSAAERQKDLRDSLWGRALILGVLLILTTIVAKTCGAHEDEITQEEAVAIAIENASFVPCDETGCVVVRALNQGIPARLVWVVGLAESLGPDGKPLRHENFEVDTATGEVTRRP